MGWASSNRKMYVPWNRRVVGVRSLHHFTKHFLNLCDEYIFDEIHHCLYFHTVFFWVDQRNLLFALELLTKMLSCGRTTSQGAGLMSQLKSQESVILSAICDLLTMQHEWNKSEEKTSSYIWLFSLSEGNQLEDFEIHNRLHEEWQLIDISCHY